MSGISGLYKYRRLKEGELYMPHPARRYGRLALRRISVVGDYWGKEVDRSYGEMFVIPVTRGGRE